MKRERTEDGKIDTYTKWIVYGKSQYILNTCTCRPVKNPGANMHTICICTTVLLSEKEKRKKEKNGVINYILYLYGESL